MMQKYITKKYLLLAIYVAVFVVFTAGIYYLFSYSKRHDFTREYTSGVPYPVGKSYIQVTQQLLMPLSFDTPLEIKKDAFDIYGMLHPSSEDYTPGQDFSAEAQKYDGAKYDYATKTLTLRDGYVIKRKKLQGIDRLAVKLGSYKSGRDVLIDMRPLDFKLLFLPINNTHLRVYNSYAGPNGKTVYYDKTYYQLCEAYESIDNPQFYLDMLDFAIRGDVSAIRHLSWHEQMVLLDTVGISMAEYYAESNVFSFYVSMMSDYQPMLASRTSGIYNAIRDSLLGHGMLQLVDANTSRKKGEPLQLLAGRGDCMYYYQVGYFHRLIKIKQINERIITQALRDSYPYDWAFLNARTGYAFADNFFNMLAYLTENPQLYDDVVRFSVRKILYSMHDQVPHINRLMKKAQSRLINTQANERRAEQAGERQGGAGKGSEQPQPQDTLGSGEDE